MIQTTSQQVRSPHLAAQYCADLTADGHSDWYLPAKDELNLFWNGGTPVAAISGTYWSSNRIWQHLSQLCVD